MTALKPLHTVSLVAPADPGANGVVARMMVRMILPHDRLDPALDRALATRMIRDVIEWEAIRQDWYALHPVSPTATGKIMIMKRDGCSIAIMDQGIETCPAQMRVRTRGWAGQEIRKAERSGVLTELASAADADSGVDDLVQLHQAHWTAEGMHCQLVRQCLRGWRAVLARLLLDGQAQVVLNGLVTDAEFDLYQLGVNPAVRNAPHSPCTAAKLVLMMELVRGNVTLYDFFRGNSAFAKAPAAEQHHVDRLIRRRFNARAVLDPIQRLSSRAPRNVARRFAASECKGSRR